MRRNLVIVRAGDASLHPKWLAGVEQRNFDIFVSYYGSAKERFSKGADYYERASGLKWPRLAEITKEHEHLLSSYDACWFPDDDLLAETSTINRMFEVFHAYELWLAQPALAAGSHLSHHITAQVAGTRLRFTDFVEIMCPIFSRRSLAALKATFGMSISGWGLDFLWPHLLKYPQDRIAVLDETAVVHTRPVGSGSSYAFCSGLGVEPRVEQEKLMIANRLYETQRKRVYSQVAANADSG